MSDFWIGQNTSKCVTSGTIQNSRLGTVTTTTANTKGSYQQLLNSVPFDSDFMLVQGASGITDRFYALDLSVGQVGQENIILSNIMFGLVVSQFGDPSSFAGMFPLRVRAGERLSGRIQGTNSGDNINFGVTLFSAAGINYI